MPEVRERPRVLIADDEPAIREVLLLILESHGLEARAVTNGREACLAAENGEFDLIFLDVMMPEQDGLSALAELKAAPATSNVPVVMVSALSADSDVETAVAAGADGYIVKPFGANEVLAKVQEHIGYDP